MEQNPSSSSKADRKTIEKNRRNHMKGLYTELSCLVAQQSSTEVKPLTDQLDEAEKYIKKLQMKVEKMKEKRESLLENNPKASRFSNPNQQQIQIHESGNALVINLVTGLECEFMFTETIRMLHQEGLEIVNASFSVNQNTVLHTINAKVGEYASEGSIARVSERLKKFVAAAT